MQVPNDAWFGTVSGPYQHLAQARLRDMVKQRDELNAAIGELQDQMKWGERMLASMDHKRAAE